MIPAPSKVNAAPSWRNTTRLMCRVCTPISPEMKAGFQRFGFEEAEADPEPFQRPTNVLEIERQTVFAVQPADQRQP